jgi:hypothetical protein
MKNTPEESMPEHLLIVYFYCAMLKVQFDKMKKYINNIHQASNKQNEDDIIIDNFLEIINLMGEMNNFTDYAIDTLNKRSEDIEQEFEQELEQEFKEEFEEDDNPFYDIIWN